MTLVYIEHKPWPAITLGLKAAEEKPITVLLNRIILALWL